jgi:LPS sulfotransferase NodH
VNRGLDLGLVPGHREYRRFIIGCMGRTGSNFLASSISAHKNAIAFGELFNNTRHERIGWSYSGFDSTDSLVRLREQDPVQFLETAVYKKYPMSIQAVGFKLFYYHARKPQWEAVWPYLRDSSVAVLHLKRKDLLALQLSMTKALKSKKWSTRENESTKSSTISLSYEDCLTGFETVRRWQQDFDGYFTESIEVYYEDIKQDYHGEMRRVQDYLGIEYQPTKSPLKKQETLPLHLAIANYGELKERFAGGEWEYLFDSASKERRN